MSVMARPVACTCQSDIGVHWDLLRQTAWKAHAFCKDTDKIMKKERPKRVEPKFEKSNALKNGRVQKGKHHNPKLKIKKHQQTAKNTTNQTTNSQSCLADSFLSCSFVSVLDTCWIRFWFHMVSQFGRGEGEGQNEFRTKTCKMGGLNARFLFCRCFFSTSLLKVQTFWLIVYFKQFLFLTF